MKKSLLILLIVTVVFSCMSFSGLAQNNIDVKINGEIQLYEQMPVMIDNRVLVPMRAIFESLGANVSWDNSTNTVMAKKGDTVVSLTIGNEKANVNGNDVELDVAPTLVNDRTMVPVRFVSETLGADVSWDDSTNTVIIESETEPSNFVKRPVPTEFETGSSFDEIIYYPDLPSAEEQLAKLGEGKSIITTEQFIKNYTGNTDKYGSVETVNVVGMPFDKAVRCTVNEVPSTPYGFQINNNLCEGVEEGDVVLVTVYMRTISGGLKETQAGQIQIIVENKATTNKVVAGNVTSGPEWQAAYFPFVVSKENIDKALWAPIRLGFFEQVIEIGGYSMVDYGKNVDITDMPSSVGYKGIEKDAQWRKDALARIEQIRKGDMNIVVKDECGNIIPDAQVKVEQTESAFRIGTAVGNISSSTNPKYKEALEKYFNGAVFEVHTKWNVYEQDPQKPRNSVEWLKSHGINNIRGHLLMTDGYFPQGASTLPDDIMSIIDNKEKLDKRIKDHIFTIMNDFKDDFIEWDVLNEYTGHFNNPKGGIYSERYGDAYILDWFRWADEADPNAKLFINETRITGDNATVDFFSEILDYLNDNNIKWDGIGVEAHFSTTCDPMRFYDELDRLASYNKRITLTEFDANIGDEELQASFTRDIIIAMFSHEAVDGFYMWGFYDGAHWLNNAPLFKKDWTLKKSGEQFADLFYNKFWTRDTGKTDSNGIYSLRGYYGDYEITASKNGVSKTINASLEKGSDNNTFVITLK